MEINVALTSQQRSKTRSSQPTHFTCQSMKPKWLRTLSSSSQHSSSQIRATKPMEVLAFSEKVWSNWVNLWASLPMSRVSVCAKTSLSSGNRKTRVRSSLESSVSSWRLSMTTWRQMSPCSTAQTWPSPERALLKFTQCLLSSRTTSGGWGQTFVKSSTCPCQALKRHLQLMLS